MASTPSTRATRPSKRRLAARGVKLTQAYAASPLCSPTRSSILAGQYPARTGITAPVCHLPQVQLEKRLSPGNPNQRVLVADSLTRLKTDHKTLANVFHDAGYATAHFGKWHLGHGKGYEARDRGFDVDIPHTPRAAGPGGGYLAPWRFVTDKEFAGKQGEHIDLWMAGKAGEFIQSNRGKPFFINFWMYSVHGPWNAEASRVEGFKKSADPKAAQRNPLYAAMLSHMDEAVGALFHPGRADYVTGARGVVVPRLDAAARCRIPRDREHGEPGRDELQEALLLGGQRWRRSPRRLR